MEPYGRFWAWLAAEPEKRRLVPVDSMRSVEVCADDFVRALFDESGETMPEGAYPVVVEDGLGQQYEMTVNIWREVHIASGNARRSRRGK
jgi:hypothetical protein